MNIFDIIGPVMVGPSSSHTAGAAKIGKIAHKLMAEKIVSAEILFHGSFEATGKGHGTDRAVLAGLLGMDCDDERIPDAFRIAQEEGLVYTFGSIDLGENAHPNSVRMYLTGESGKKLEVVAASVGGGRIEMKEIDGLKTVFSGNYPTLIVENDDHPGVVAGVLQVISSYHINVATVQLDRDSRGGHAVTVAECDQEIPSAALDAVAKMEGILKVTYLSLEGETCTDR